MPFGNMRNLEIEQPVIHDTIFFFQEKIFNDFSKEKIYSNQVKTRKLIPI